MTTTRPIIFSDEMVRAILDGRKTQTRRVAKVTSEGCRPGLLTPLAGFVPRRPEQHVEYCPYGQPGDRLWVGETWRQAYPQTSYSLGLVYRADRAKALGMDEYSQRHEWRPSIHMPRWASRITLEITGVRIERLQEISEADARAEGAEPYMHVTHPSREGLRHVDGFHGLWESIHCPDSWGANPWVWVIEFRRLES
jgi:hypothetical protein